MNIELLNTKQISQKLNHLILDSDEIYWAVAWGTYNNLCQRLLENRKKIKQIVFGTHFYQTDPNLLQQFVDNPKVHFMENDAAGTFHPKIYFFKKNKFAYAVIGSANFTNGGLTKNDEAATYVEGAFKDSFFQDLLQMVNDYWRRGKEIDQNFVDNYRLQHKATERYRAQLAKDRKVVKSKPDANHQDLRSWNWQQYIELTSNRESYEMRLSILREAKKIFSSSIRINELRLDVRQKLAGTYPYTEDNALDWGLFGSMKGAGVFRSLVNSNSNFLSQALDQIPLTGEISKKQYEQFIVLFKKAFKGKKRKGGIPVATRLLTLKRPDTFICVNSKNGKSLAKDLGFSASTLNFDKYWEEVILPISESVWWQSDRPSGLEGELWDGRAAMLDIIYYMGSN